MDQKGHRLDQRGLQMYEKGLIIELFDQKYLFFSGIFLSGVGGDPVSPPPPLTDNHSAKKSLAKWRGTVPPHWKISRKWYLTASLGKPPFKKSAVFFNIVQKAFDPPPLSFEHYVGNFYEGILTKER